MFSLIVIWYRLESRHGIFTNHYHNHVLYHRSKNHLLHGFNYQTLSNMALLDVQTGDRYMAKQGLSIQQFLLK